MSNEKIIPLSPSETEILRLVWELKIASVQDVSGKLPEGRSIAYATVQTLLRRLEKKGYVKHDVKGKAHMFYPVAKREDVIASAIGAFVDKLFGGDSLGLVHYLAKRVGEVKPGEDIREWTWLDINKLPDDIAPNIQPIIEEYLAGK